MLSVIALRMYFRITVLGLLRLLCLRLLKFSIVHSQFTIYQFSVFHRSLDFRRRFEPLLPAGLPTLSAIAG